MWWIVGGDGVEVWCMEVSGCVDWCGGVVFCRRGGWMGGVCGVEVGCVCGRGGVCVC